MYRKSMITKMWRFLDLGKIDGFYSAALFEAIGRHVGSGSSPETILFWRVGSPVVYLGYHQYADEEINADFCSRNNIGIVRRILGGGCGFCDENQLLYSVIGREGGVIPNDIQVAYGEVLHGVVYALETLGARGNIEPARNAVYSMGRKISGNAQGRFGGAVLVNGSLLMDFDFELMDKVLKNPTKNLHPVAHAKEGMITLKEIGITDLDAIKNALRRGFEKALGISSQDGTLALSEVDTANRLLDKYLRHDWTYRMDIKRALRKKRTADERPESRLGRAHPRQQLRQLVSPTRMAKPYVEYVSMRHGAHDADERRLVQFSFLDYRILSARSYHRVLHKDFEV